MTYKFKEGDVYLSNGDKECISGRLAGHIEGDWLGMSLYKKEEDIKKWFDVGDIIGGFCNGYFGRDDYEEKVCVAVFDNFAVFKYLESGEGVVLNYPKDKYFWSCVECWRK